MTAVLTRQAFASRYVKRCLRCRVVRGNSSFNGKPGRRSDVCRACTEHAKKLSVDLKKLVQFKITERRLAHELEALRLKIRTLENERVLLEQEELFAKASA